LFNNFEYLIKKISTSENIHVPILWVTLVGVLANLHEWGKPVKLSQSSSGKILTQVWICFRCSKSIFQQCFRSDYRCALRFSTHFFYSANPQTSCKRTLLVFWFAARPYLANLQADRWRPRSVHVPVVVLSRRRQTPSLYSDDSFCAWGHIITKRYI